MGQQGVRKEINMNNKILKNISYGMYVVGAKESHDVGCIINTAVQITSNPITIAISLNHDNYTNKIIKKTNKFSICILPEDIDTKIIGAFGYQSSKDIDKYENIDTTTIDGLKVLKNTCGNLICQVINQVETKTHTIFIAEVTNMDNYQEKTPMTYHYYHEVLKGKSPKNAPTYIEEETKKTVWKCSVCGYEVEMDELPNDYICPICQSPASSFVKIK